jgi:hypothetical protein
VRTHIESLEVAVAGVEVVLEVHPAHGQVPHPRHGGDLGGGQHPTGALDRADDRLAGGALDHPADVVGRLGLRDPDPVGPSADGGQVGLAQLGAGGVDPDPGRTVGQGLSDHRPCRVLGVRRDRVLQVEHDRVGAGLEHPAQQLGVVAGSEQVAAVHQTTPCSRSRPTSAPSSPSSV